ncbi:FecR family protein [Dyella amyloliquefaciens]|uniref:FecR family protein n=1 Tax=Dyella amyloliquefaciens TaxID=1770545 RepID=UPI00102ECBDA|nr:FecR domain-containing protein [Dyella amyloliquefaciens]
MMAPTTNEQALRIAADWWVRLRDAKAAEHTTEQWLAWIDEDQAHLAAFERVTELATRLGALGEVSHAKLMAEFAPAQTPRRWWALSAAAAAAVLVAGGYIGWTVLERPAAAQLYTSAIATQRDVTLDDGSRVAMGGATRLTARFGRDHREVELDEGEVYFEVVHDSSRPFVVRAGKLRIEDIGTAFDVRRTGDHVTIAMAEGRVHISDDASGQGHGLEAVAGQAVSYDPSRIALNVTSIDPAQAAAWRDARLEFDNEPLSVVVANINRYRSHPVRIADAGLQSMTFTGTVKTNAIDDWLQALPQVLPLKVSEVGGQTVLSDARGKHGAS